MPYLMGLEKGSAGWEIEAQVAVGLTSLSWLDANELRRSTTAGQLRGDELSQLNLVGIRQLFSSLDIYIYIYIISSS